MPVDSPEIRNEAQIVNLDSRTKRFVERRFAGIPHNHELGCSMATCKTLGRNCSDVTEVLPGQSLSDAVH